MGVSFDPNTGAIGWASGGGGGVPDEAWSEVDISNKIFDLFGGVYLDLGTGGNATLRYTRVGRHVHIKGGINFAADHATGAIVIMDFDLPIAPLIPDTSKYIAFVSEFGYAVFTESSPGAADGRLEPLGPAVSYFGGPSGIIFTQLSRNDHDGAGGNVFRTDYPFDATGRAFSLTFSKNYEAATAAGA